jgi:hypothetical protein
MNLPRPEAGVNLPWHGFFASGTVCSCGSVVEQKSSRGLQPLSVADTVVKPMLWVARQQPDATGHVNQFVLKRADNIVRTLLGAAEQTPG